MSGAAVSKQEPAWKPAGARFLGFPLDGFGFLTSLLLAASSGFFAFFLVTALGIFGLLGYNLLGHHAVSYTLSYRSFGLPVAVVVWVVAFAVFGTLWVRARVKSLQATDAQ
jgi:hypothetical protein